MDPDIPRSSPRKVKFAPKGPPRKVSRPKVQAKTEVVADDSGDNTDASEALLRRANENLTGRRPKAERKSSVQVAFAHVAETTTSIRTYGNPKKESRDRSAGADLTRLTADNSQDLISLPSSTPADRIGENVQNASYASHENKQKEYKEPWDYNQTYYPITLPWRRPYSGDPELLDEAEFGETAVDMEYDESTINSALELGLLKEDNEARMLYVQLPPTLPLGSKASSSVPSGGTAASAMTLQKGSDSSISDLSGSEKRKENVGRPESSGGRGSKKGSHLEELPGGYMGKMLVYKSGAVKLKLGEILYDVSPGSNCAFPQDVMAINTVDNNCCKLGEVHSQRIVVSPDVDSLLESS